MTVIRPNSISGITSLTAHRGSIDFYAHDGSAARFDNINSNVTSGVSTFASLNITGDLDVGGALTYEDVTNVDSIGVVTARNGLNVTGGNIGIGENNPQNSIHISGSAPAIRFADSGANGSAFSIIEDNNGLLKIRNDAGNSGTGSGIAFEVDAAERLRITSGGDLAVGATGDVYGPARLNVRPNNRDTQFSASDGNTWHDIVVKQNDTNSSGGNAAGIAFEIGTGGWHANAGTGIAAIKDSNSSDYGSHLAFITRPHAAVAEERVRITSDGELLVGSTVSNSAKFKVSDGGGYEFAFFPDDSSINSLVNYDRSGGAYVDCKITQKELQLWTGTSPAERLRIQSDGKVLVYGSLGAGNLPLGGNAASAALQIKGTTQYQGIAFGQNASNATIGIDNTKLVYTANANPANLGGGVQTSHEWWSGSSGGGGPSKIAEMNTSGQLYLGGYPLTHTVASGSNLKLRAGTGAWGISIGMRSPQNDYAYIGFHDKDGTEQIADINVQRTGANTGHMVFSTNNGSGGSETRLRIADSGRLCYSPDSNFTAESTNIAMSIIASGGDIAGYPGINIRSTDSGGGTNSQNGMSIITTDGNWSLYTNSGNVHGLGLFAGNSATSGNCGLYVRSDKKITMGPETNNEAFTTNTCGQAVHIAGGGLGIGAISNYSAQSGTGGRYVLGWYHANAYTGRNGNAYLHLTTSLWGGGSPAGNSEYIMGGFKIKSYRYSPAGVAEEIIMFHNWSAGVPGYSREHNGTWDPANAVYVRANGYVTIRLNSQNYVGYIIDLIQYNWYPVRDIRVTNATFSNSSTL